MPASHWASYYSFDTGLQPFYLSGLSQNVSGDHLQSNCVCPNFPKKRWFNGSPGRKLQILGIAILACGSIAVPQCGLSQVVADFSQVSPVSTATQSPAVATEWFSATASVAPAQIHLPSEMNPSPRAEALVSLSSSPVVAAFPFPAESGSADDPQVREVTQRRPKSPEQEIIVEGLVSYGNYRIFGTGYDEKLFTAGIEYDRHSWDYFLNAQIDYVAEFLPFMLLDKPLKTDIYGYPSAPIAVSKLTRQYVPGVGIFPIGFRMQWRSGKSIKPYLEAKGGMLGFTQKVPSSEATYENFSFQSATGVQVKMSDRWGLRLGLFSDMHFSDAFIVPINPGLDVMNANLGLSYHF